MRKHELYTDYHDHFEYFGNTEIERIRKQGKRQYGMTGYFLTPLMRRWSFSTISAASSLGTMPE